MDLIFSKAKDCAGRPAWCARASGFEFFIQRAWKRKNIYDWQVLISDLTASLTPRVDSRRFPRIADAKIWANERYKTLDSTRAQPGAKGARRQSAAPRGGRLGRERTS